jgi:hypothetical protein
MINEKRALTNEQKEEIIVKVLEVWEQHPHLRLGQMIYIALNDKDIFYVEDEDFVTELQKKFNKVEV